MRLTKISNQHVNYIEIRYGHKLVPMIEYNLSHQSSVNELTLKSVLELLTHLISGMDSNERAAFLSLLPELDAPINSTRETQSSQAHAQAPRNRLPNATRPNTPNLIESNLAESTIRCKDNYVMYDESFFELNQLWLKQLNDEQLRLFCYCRDLLKLRINPVDVLTDKSIAAIAEILVIYMNTPVHRESDVSKTADANMKSSDK